MKKPDPIKKYKIQVEPKKKFNSSLSGGGTGRSSSLSADLSYQITPRFSASTSMSGGIASKPSGQVSITYTAPIKKKKK